MLSAPETLFGRIEGQLKTLNSMQRTLLVVHPGSLGDVLLALPAMRALRAAFPGHALGLMAHGQVIRLLVAGGEVHKGFTLEGQSLTHLVAGTDSMDTEIEQWLLKCDVAVGWLADPDRTLHSAFRKFGIAHILVASPHSSGYQSVHQTDRFLETIRSVASMSSPSPSLQLPHDVIQEAALRLTSLEMFPSRPIVILHPGSGSRHKCTAPTLFANLLRHYESHGIQPLVVGGPADVHQLTGLQLSSSAPFRVLQNLDLVSMAGVIAHADRFIGHDSGLTHLAACLQVPTIALFGPTDPGRWAPRGSYVSVVTGPSCHCNGWETVRLCDEKPCLQISLEQVISTCTAMCWSGMSPTS